MRILVNYEPAEQKFLSMLVFHLRAQGFDAAGTSATCTISELLAKAKQGSCHAILLCNASTLANCVPGDKPTLDKYRGSRLNFSVPCIVGNSLSHLVTVPHGEWLLGQDLKKFKEIHRPAAVFDFEVLDTVDKFPTAYAALSQSLLISIDVETDLLNETEEAIEGGDSVITCCAWTGMLKDGSLITYVLPFIDFGLDHWKEDTDYAAAIQLMQRLNALPQPKVLQNGMYDVVQTLRYHAPINNWQLDTMGIAHSEFSELPKTLDFIASYQLHDYVYWKDDADAAKKEKDQNKYWAYNAKDTWHTLRIVINQLRTMPAYAKTNYAAQFKLCYVCIYCGFEGILIDNRVRQSKRDASEAQLRAAQKALRVMFADPNFNPGSWQQVELYIYKVFGAKKPNIGKSKSCTDEKNLIAVAQQHPLLSKLTTEILSYREAQKAIGTYYDFKQKQSRLLYSLDPFGTETSRMACRASSLWVGTQVQNIPGYVKPMLVADEGYEMCEIDNSQSEARCTAYCSQETSLIAALESATHDFYKTLGTLFFKIPYEEVSDFFRNKVLKKIVHGTNYMMGAGTFIENIGVQILHDTAANLGIKLVPIPRHNSKTEMTINAFAKSLLEAYHVPFPRVRLWYKELYNEILTTGKLVGPLGNTRKFFGNIAKDHNMLRGAVAHQPQNLSVSILNIGLWKIYKQLVIPSNGKFRLKAQVHDSVLSQYPASERDYWVPRKQALMHNPVVIHGRTLVIPTDVKVGKSWGDMKKYKAPAV